MNGSMIMVASLRAHGLDGSERERNGGLITSHVGLEPIFQYCGVLSSVRITLSFFAISK